MEINDNYRNLRKHNVDLNKIIRELYSQVPSNILANFFISREKSLNKFYFHKKHTLNKKISILKFREALRIKPIKYCTIINQTTRKSIINTHKFTFHKDVEFKFHNPNTDPANTININIEPQHFKQKEPFDIEVNNKW